MASAHTRTVLGSNSLQIGQQCPLLHTHFQTGSEVVLCEQSGIAFSLEGWREYESLWQGGCPYCGEQRTLALRVIDGRHVSSSLLPPHKLRVGMPTVYKGKWVNILMWEPSPLPKVSYLVVRKYDGVPKSHTDGEQRGLVSETYFRDEEPEMGQAPYYAVYSCDDKTVSEIGAKVRADIRVSEVTNLHAFQESPGQVRLTWQPPKGIYDIVVRRTLDGPTQSPQKGIKIPVVGNSWANDRNAPPSSKITYTVFCRFIDKSDSAVMITSLGAHVQIAT